MWSAVSLDRRGPLSSGFCLALNKAVLLLLQICVIPLFQSFKKEPQSPETPGTTSRHRSDVVWLFEVVSTVQSGEVGGTFKGWSLAWRFFGYCGAALKKDLGRSCGAPCYLGVGFPVCGFFIVLLIKEFKNRLRKMKEHFV